MSTVLIITQEWITPDLFLRMKNEGHNVLLAVKYPTNILKGTIKRVPYAERLKWASKADLVVYDEDNSQEVHDLRKQGISVIAGGKLVDKLEHNRKWASDVSKACGMKCPEMINIESLDQIKEIITSRKGRWVLKQEGKLDGIKGLNFVSKLPDSKDLLDFIDVLKDKWIEGVKPDFVLQEFIDGHEFACGSFWNGHEFMKDAQGDELCYENWEHKALFPGNLGESTGEQYTVVKCIKAKHSKLFMETLDKCRDLLKGVDYRGYFDVNTKTTEKGAHFLEFTPRMGVPITSAQIEINKKPWYDFLKALADGDNFIMDYDPRFCLVSWLYTKPFPYVNNGKLSALYEEQFKDPPTDMQKINQLMTFRLSNSEGVIVNFAKDFTDDDLKHIHMDAVMFEDGILKVGNPDGYVLTVSEQDETVEGAGAKVETILKKIIVPKAFWRNDFDKTNYHKSKDDLEKWGYIQTDEPKDLMKKNRDETKRVEARMKLRKMIFK